MTIFIQLILDTLFIAALFLLTVAAFLLMILLTTAIFKYVKTAINDYIV